MFKRVKLLRKLRSLSDSIALIIDVDGVLTDGTFWYSAKGKEYKRFAPHDAEALNALKQHFPIKIISADERGKKISERRVNDLGFDLQIVSSSARRLLVSSMQAKGRNVLFIGDSISDIPAMSEATFAVCPSNACIGVSSYVDYVLRTQGGRGVMSEIKQLLEEALGEDYFLENF